MRHQAILNVLNTGLAVALLTVSHPAVPGDDDRHWEDDDQVYDRARRAVDSGEALPIAQLLERLKARVPGEVVGIEFAHEGGRWIYEFRIVDDDGRLLEVHVDARTGGILPPEDD